MEAERQLTRFHPNSIARGEPTEGGAFAYAAAPRLFLGRSGLGPLRVAFDTNVLIDLAEIGEAVLDGVQKEPVGTHELNLAALTTFIQIWMLRDIRIHVFERQISDYRRRIQPEHLATRIRQVQQIRSALFCLGHESDASMIDATFELETVLARTPDGADSELLNFAIREGCHVFLTRDAGILREVEALGAVGLAPMTPIDLVTQFGVQLSGSRGSDAGDDPHAFFFAAGGDLLAADNHKWLHIIAACDNFT